MITGTKKKEVYKLIDFALDKSGGDKQMLVNISRESVAVYVLCNDTCVSCSFIRFDGNNTDFRKACNEIKRNFNEAKR